MYGTHQTSELDLRAVISAIYLGHHAFNDVQLYLSPSFICNLLIMSIIFLNVWNALKAVTTAHYVGHHACDDVQLYYLFPSLIYISLIISGILIVWNAPKAVTTMYYVRHHAPPPLSV